jgi:hypothetical protein
MKREIGAKNEKLTGAMAAPWRNRENDLASGLLFRS